MGLTTVNSLPRPEPQKLASALEALAARFGNRLVTSQAVREQHGHTTTWLTNQPPDAVVMAQETADIQDVVRICAANGVPVIPFGTGTSLEGQINAPAGGVCIDLRDMNKVLAVHAEDLDCVIQPGVTRKMLNEYIRDQGLFFPIDPGADASLGGMASTRASGTNAVRYGTIRENVLALKVVRGDGEIVTTGTRAKKSSAGYDLTHLFIGAEGTLGIISELTIKLRGIPETIAAAACSFETVAGACQATILAIQTGIPVARIELLNAEQVKACNAYSKLSLPETPLLLLEFHGSEAEVAAQSQSFAEIAAECGGGGFEWTTKPEDRTRLWQARHDSYWAVRGLRPGAGVVATDVCVPISRLADCVVETEEDLKRLGLLSPIVGHVGDGNFHCSLLADTDNAAEMVKAEEFLHRLVERAQAMGGTCTGEHGVGQGKQKYLLGELGPEALDAMRALKRAFDPHNIFNPGKIVPAA
ncbi:FAD-binding protein [Bradyrhizobium sp. U87765 SZCCT0131]|uniref:FAD-binding oxidoreductase n=1 Tax=unclassified Bradyrhizobium TaxID=2631580 RepID=UPI001BAA9FD7|nr:FAD-binding protein [Bradyrhizobium sp. U87765 SZCCT0131]MBR1264216.1 FAD-binding protein [Bradyrhizobium sp. U87765 SZCCT0134]MBR1308001.1 FAD-binding protein [Bradyrhizobium sp. U87765 SZCCT0110]MBR1320466.1 FAD-binding protein [Bradyrhizobium sp. U87765 SZCCT0109]MBR1348421.1 FAD-binding protein [Bradyrhizobium sp. U87765 SZCCT0048]